MIPTEYNIYMYVQEYSGLFTFTMVEKPFEVDPTLFEQDITNMIMDYYNDSIDSATWCQSYIPMYDIVSDPFDCISDRDNEYLLFDLVSIDLIEYIPMHFWMGSYYFVEVTIENEIAIYEDLFFIDLYYDSILGTLRIQLYV